MGDLRFGTDGWRARIARDFTLQNLRRVTQATCDHFREQGARLAVLGYDRRFAGRHFAQEVARVLLGNGLAVRLSDRPEPTPALSCQIVESGADFGIMITASHNPPDYQGFKVKTADGASAPPEVTAAIEARIDGTPVRSASPSRGVGLGALEIGPFAPAHQARLAQAAELSRIRAAGLRVAVDSMHGTGARRIEEILAGAPTTVSTLRGARDPLFGGGAPEPTRTRLGGLLEAMRGGEFDVGLATDGDADRIAAVDDTGRFVSPLQLIAVLALHLIRERRTPGGIAKTFANTIYLDRIAAAEQREFHCLPVGFHGVAQLLQRGKVAIGGEESGGIGVSGYIPERDGLLAGLLLLEAVATARAPLSELVRRLQEEFGEYHYDRRDLARPAARIRASLERLAAEPPARVAGLRVTGVDPLDGVKLLFGEEGWLLLRGSGTEPILRVYAEARSSDRVQRLLQAGAKLAG